MNERAIAYICQDSDCTGCMACKNVCPKKAITFVDNQKGFWIPSIDSNKCIGCKLCVKTCPALQPRKSKATNEVYAGWSLNKTVQKSSSSGGLFTELARKTLQNSGVVYGARWNDDFSEVLHDYIEDIKDLEILKLSKYVQSNMNSTYCQVKAFVESGRDVLFVGTPCQIAGLRTFLKKDYSNLLLVDLVCHGVPSPLLFKEYHKILCTKYNSKIVDFKFRWKNPIWGCNYMKVSFEDGSQYIGGNLSDPFFYLFEKKFSLRDSCYKCKYANLNRESDITIADFWGFAPSSIKELAYDQGTSMILVNTKKGQKALSCISKNLYLKKETIERALSANLPLSSSFSRPVDLEDFWKDYHERGFEYASKKHTSQPSIRGYSRFNHFKKKYKFLIPFKSILLTIKNKFSR